MSSTPPPPARIKARDNVHRRYTHMPALPMHRAGKTKLLPHILPLSSILESQGETCFPHRAHT